MNGAHSAPLTVVLELNDEQATLELAATLARQSVARDIIALTGELGAGKTTFARGFIGAKRNQPEDVPSPTFTLVQLYETDRETIYHFDLYRLNAPEEAYELDIEDAFASGISLIEWPEKLGALLPRDSLGVRLEFSENPGARRAVITAPPHWHGRLKEAGLD
ncbi:MAG: tRNA (adenosine(37)-N6)-threonylcarbamoyltransferase complex ATPase subunit type 1 TsaE [Rhodospirillaceae bacterium]|jgi:tRNA threonylcarbamoyladenosine biosynthesis protein TsaE